MKIQRPTIQFVFKNVLVNPFMTYSYFHVFLHPTAYLFRTPFFTKQLFYISLSTPSANFSLSSIFCKCVCLFRMITPSTQILLKFSTYSRFLNANYFRNFQLCKSYFKNRIYYVLLFQPELDVVFHLCSSFLSVNNGKISWDKSYLVV